MSQRPATTTSQTDRERVAEAVCLLARLIAQQAAGEFFRERAGGEGNDDGPEDEQAN